MADDARQPLRLSEGDSGKHRKGDPRPQSAVGHGVGIAGLAGLVLWIMIARNFGAVMTMLGIGPELFGMTFLPERASGPYSALMATIFCGVAMVVWSLLVDKVHRRASTGIDWSAPRPVSEVMDISQIKLAGLWATWAIIAAIYAISRWYWAGQYVFSMEVFTTLAPLLFIGSIPYVIWLDRYLVEPKDGAWHFGAMLCGQAGWDREAIANHARSWLVKGFFLAFMISIVPGGFADIVQLRLADIIGNPVLIAHWLIIAMFVVDVQFATVGYMLTMKPLDAHIRTANPYLAGWLAALICYPPFILMGDGGPLNYHVNTADWAYWFAGNTPLLIVWGAALVFLTAVYAWATVAFGLRFSNLTHRGILTHGPYGWTKHPAYLAKNLYWWLATLPFLTTSGSFTDMVRNTALLALVSGVYYWRARTEEKHLMADPDYAAYAAWMDRNAMIPRSINALAGRLVGWRRPQPVAPQGKPDSGSATDDVAPAE
ncbi:MAG: isoprenylcysteine carboxylmethyltransferase family protein [Pseudomonadota bacterium]